MKVKVNYNFKRRIDNIYLILVIVLAFSIVQHQIYSQTMQNLAIEKKDIAFQRESSTLESGYYVYFVHGYYGSNLEFSDLVNYLVEDKSLFERYTGFQYFDYFSQGLKQGLSKTQVHYKFSISDYAYHFYRQLVSTHNSSTQIDIVGHSLGGLIAREMIRLYRKNLENNGIIIKRVISLGTPHIGSLSVLKFISPIMDLFSENKWNTPVLKSVFPGSKFLQNLNFNASRYSKGIEWIVAAGISSHSIMTLTDLLVGEKNDGLIGLSSALAEFHTPLGEKSNKNCIAVPLFERSLVVFNNVHHGQLINDPINRKTYSQLNSWLPGNLRQNISITNFPILYPAIL